VVIKGDDENGRGVSSGILYEYSKLGLKQQMHYKFRQEIDSF
jgi:hypothetical protein